MALHEKCLQYLGKKAPKKVVIPKQGINATFGNNPTWVPALQADWLMKTNPCMFRFVDERGGDFDPVEDASAIISATKDDGFEDLIDSIEDEPEDEIFVCACGKEYKNQEWYEKHVSKCEDAK